MPQKFALQLFPDCCSCSVAGCLSLFRLFFISYLSINVFFSPIICPSFGCCRYFFAFCCYCLPQLPLKLNIFVFTTITLGHGSTQSHIQMFVSVSARVSLVCWCIFSRLLSLVLVPSFPQMMLLSCRVYFIYFFFFSEKA